MCPGDDSHLTLEFEDHYVIKPSIQFSGVVDFSVNRCGERGRPVEQRLRIPFRPQSAFPGDRRNCRAQSHRRGRMIPYARQDRHSGRCRRGRRGPSLGLSHARTGGSSLRAGSCVANRHPHAVAVNSATSALHIACLALGLEGRRPPLDGPQYVCRIGELRAILRRGCRFRRHRSDHLESEHSGTQRETDARRTDRAVSQGCGASALRRPADGAGGDLGTGTTIRIQGAGRRFALDWCVAQRRTGREAAAGRTSPSFSFHPVKIITSGEGGMALTNDDRLAETMRMLRTHGITRDHVALYEHRTGFGCNRPATGITSSSCSASTID